MPTILATADHVSSAYKHDAASLWIENATSSNFYICLRELQNYDGFHEELFVVCEFLNIAIRTEYYVITWPQDSDYLILTKW